MLCNAWTQSNVQLMKTAGRGPRAAEGGTPSESAALPLKRAKKKTAKRKTRGVRNPVFKVSLPLTKGSIVLQRTAFAVDELPASPRSLPPTDWGLASSPESPMEEWDWGQTPPPQDTGDAPCQYTDLEGNHFEDQDVNDGESFFRPDETFTQNALMLPHDQRQNSYSEWPSAEPWDYSNYHSAGTSVETPTNECPNADYYQQLPYTQGHHHAINSSTQPYAGYHHSNFGAAPEPPQVQFLEIQQRQLQTYMELSSGHFQAAPHWTQSVASAAAPPSVRAGPPPCYDAGRRPTHQQHFPGVAPGLTVSYGWAGLMLPAHANLHQPAYPSSVCGVAPY